MHNPDDARNHHGVMMPLPEIHWFERATVLATLQGPLRAAEAMERLVPQGLILGVSWSMWMEAALKGASRDYAAALAKANLALQATWPRRSDERVRFHIAQNHPRDVIGAACCLNTLHYAHSLVTESSDAIAGALRAKFQPLHDDFVLRFGVDVFWDPSEPREREDDFQVIRVTGDESDRDEIHRELAQADGWVLFEPKRDRSRPSPTRH